MLNRILLLLATAAALAFAACGDDDDEGGGTTKAGFIEKADAVCAEAEAKTEDIVRAKAENPAKPTPPEVLAVVKELIPVQRDTLAQIRDLEKPEGDEDQINEFLDKADAATDEVEQIDDPQQAVAAVEASGTRADPFYEANQVAEEYGLQKCAE